jgi:RNA ligase
MEKNLFLLVGPQGSGKTSYCREHLPGCLRISQDDQGRQEHFHLFQEVLQRGEPCIVVDRINAVKYQRRRYLEPARQHGYRTHIVWLNVDRDVCLRRCRSRTDHPTLAAEEAEKALRHYFQSFQTPSRREADTLTIIGPSPAYVPVHDLTEIIGPRRHIIVGDVHGCLDELRELLDGLQFDPASDVLMSVGDIVDRGPRIRETVEFLFGLPAFHMVLGNHEYKLLRYLEGRGIKVGGGLETTIRAYNDDFPPDLADHLAALPLILKTPSGFVVHAGFDPEMGPDEQTRGDCLFMRYYGGKTYFDEINGTVWYDLWPTTGPRVFFGHIPEPDGPCLPHIVALDAGCVFGGELKAFDSRDGRCHAVKARQAYAVSHHAPAARLTPAETQRRREEYVRDGRLRGDRTDDGRLAIYTYTDQSAFDNAWDEITRNSRGHVFDLQTGECVAWPFPKFFNLGENQECLPECFPWDQPYEIYEKVDGWLGILYRHEGRFKVATRGSFHSSGAAWATEFVRGLDFSCLPDEATLCFEIIHPEHRIVLDYSGPQTLMVLAAFDRKTRKEYPRAVVAEWAEAIGLPLVPLLGHLSLEDLRRTQKDRQQCEGFVIRFCDGRRVKVKTEWYLQITRVLADLTPIAVWQAMKGGRVDGAYLVRLPEELRPLAEKYRAVLEGQYAAALLDVERTAGPILEKFGADRKALAQYVAEHQAGLGYRRPAVFFLLDGKHDRVERVIMERIYPKGNQFAADVAPR